VASSGMLPRVALVRTDVSEELSASFMRVTRAGELGTTLAVIREGWPFLQCIKPGCVTQSQFHLLLRAISGW
jgi:hypothetical protein